MKKILLTLLIMGTVVSFTKAQDVNVDGWNGYSFGLWGTDPNYRIQLWNSANYTYGPVTDYSIKMKMNNNGNRGWTWGPYNSTPIAALNTNGDMQIKRNFAAEGKLGVGLTTSILDQSPFRLNIESGDHGVQLKPTPIGTWKVGMEVDIQESADPQYQDPEFRNTLLAYAVKNDGNYSFWVQGDGTTRIDNILYAKEVFVQTDVWPDYVFKKDYELKSLEETEQFIEENNHLPGIPSEAEILEAGINVSEMNVLLLQKIEELTLYTIEQQKLIEKMAKEIEQLTDRDNQ